MPNIVPVAYNESEFVDSDVQEKIGIKSIIIYSVELPLLIFGFIFCAVFLKIVRKTRCFHQNLRFLLGNFALSFMIVIISRFMIVIPLLISFTFNTDISEIGWCRGAKALHDCGLHVGAINIIVIVIERSVATIKVDNYETKKTPILGIFMVNFQWLFSLIFVWFNQVNAQTATYSVHLTYCQREYVSKVLSIFLVIVFFCDLLAMMIFFLLLHINKRRYSHSNPQFELDYALSKRYQISENIQTTRLLYPLIMAYLIGSVIGVILLYFGGQVLRNLKENNLPITLNVYLESSNWGQSFDILFALLAILCPHLAIHGHHSLLREFKRILMFKKDPIISRQPRTINGNKLIMTMSEERQLHFQNLENMWNNSDIEKTPRRSC